MGGMGQIVFLQSGPKKKEPMVPAASLRVVEDLGVEGDHHARPRSSRQVLLMAEENCDAFGLSPGEVRENITTRGLDLQNLPPGTVLSIGDARLEITKDCEPCSFIDGLRPGLRAQMERRRGMLARVLQGGEVRIGDEIVTEPTRGGVPARI
jgi:MOSC domain-containing protein YiiM